MKKLVRSKGVKKEFNPMTIWKLNNTIKHRVINTLASNNLDILLSLVPNTCTYEYLKTLGYKQIKCSGVCMLSKEEVR